MSFKRKVPILLRKGVIIYCRFSILRSHKNDRNILTVYICSMTFL
uniref:Uncharacterized protein n=1 Tax=Anguilla anguilla TaxID=7936 RepID=A0A0E9T6U1_ANGAN